MPRPRLPYLHKQITRHGKVVWYVRKSHSRRIRLKAEYGTPEFADEYQKAIDRQPAPSTKPAKASAGSLEWLWIRYRETTAWTALRPATRKQRENIMRHVLKTSARASANAIECKDIANGRDRRSSTPAQARNFLDVMRGLFRWAAEAGLVSQDPTLEVKNPPKKQGEGFPVWTEEDVDKYCERWPLGTKERVWLDLLLYTGLRRGDVVTLGRQHVREGVATLRTEKSGRMVTVTLPILPVLAATLKAGPIGELSFVCGEKRKPLTKESFGNMFVKACRAAGIEKSAHGVRKISATRAAENGATVAELEALFGWQGGGMASLYTKGANRKRLAQGAITKLQRTENKMATSIPSPIGAESPSPIGTIGRN